MREKKTGQLESPAGATEWVQQKQVINLRKKRERKRERDAFVTYIAAGAGNERIKDVRLFFLVLFLTAL